MPEPGELESKDSDPKASESGEKRQSRFKFDRKQVIAATVGGLGLLILMVVAVVGAVTSYDNLRRYAARYIDPDLAWTFPFLVDAVVLGATLRFIAGVYRARRIIAYRLTAHAGIALTIWLNLTADQGREWDWRAASVHVVAPVAWAALVELLAHDAIADYRTDHDAPHDRIPVFLWLMSPVTSFRTKIRMYRTACPSYVTSLAEVELIRAAITGLRIKIVYTEGTSRWNAWRIRRKAAGYMWRGVIAPAEVTTVIGLTEPGQQMTADETMCALVALVVQRAPETRAGTRTDARADGTRARRADARRSAPAPTITASVTSPPARHDSAPPVLEDAQAHAPRAITGPIPERADALADARPDSVPGERERARAAFDAMLAANPTVKPVAADIKRTLGLTAHAATVRKWVNAWYVEEGGPSDAVEDQAADEELTDEPDLDGVPA
ncbi:MAG TPA: DUF2637 domain-containing protein [Kineosporiaceae bacterium]|nr:DUF2637 domain-containing protein [Kineosporiaceae bacterium]